MASLRDTVKDYQEELRDGIAWVAFWKTGRSWNAEYFHLEMSDYIYPEDRSRMEEIKQADPAARLFAKDFIYFFKISEGLGHFPTSKNPRRSR